MKVKLRPKHEPVASIRAEFPSSDNAYILALAGFFILLVVERHEQDRIAIQAFDENSDDVLAELDSLSPKGDWRDWKFYSQEDDGSITSFLELHVLNDIERRYSSKEHPLAQLPFIFDLKAIGENALHSAFVVAQSLSNVDEYDTKALENVFQAQYEPWRFEKADKDLDRASTPALLIDFLADVADVQPGESVYCPAFGQGDLLEAIIRRLSRATKRAGRSGFGNVSLSGVESNRSGVLLALARLLLAGAWFPRLALGNPLERSPGNGKANGGFDYVIAAPPFGLRVDSKLARAYRMPSQSGDNLYVQHVLDSLKPGGLGVIIIPRALLFRDSDQKLREHLARHVRLEAIVELPVAAFQSSAQVRTAVLVFSKKQPAQDAWFITESQYIEAVDANVGGDDDVDYKTLLVAVRARLRRASSIREIESEIERLESRITDQREMIEPAAAKWLADNNKILLRLARSFLSEGNASRPETEIPNDTGLVPINRIANRRWELVPARSSVDSLESFLGELKRLLPQVEIVPLQAVADVRSGSPYSRTSILEPKEYRQRFKEPPVGFIRVSDMPKTKTVTKHGLLDLFTSRVLTPEAAAKLPDDAFLKKHDVLVSVGGTVGKITWFLDMDGELLDQKTAASNGIAVIRFREPFLGKGMDAFLTRLFLSAPYQEWFAAEATGSTIQHLNITRLRELPIPLIPGAELLRLMDALDVGVSAETMLASLSARPQYTEAIRWLVDSTTVRAFADLSVRKAGASADNALSDLLKELNIFIVERRGKSSEPFLDWLIAFRDFAQAIFRALRLPPGSERFAALQGMRLGRRARFPQLFQAYESIRSSITDRENDDIRLNLPKHLLTRVQSLYDRIREICAVNENNMLADVRITTIVQPAAVAVSKPTELTISLRNEAVLPLHDIELLEPETATPHGPLLPAGGSHNWAIPWTPDKIGKQEFNVRWSGMRLDGTSVSGEAVVAVDVHSLRESSLVQRSTRSPYVAGLSLSAKDKDKFFGRQDIIAEITRSLRTEGPGTVLILEGVRRVGKTSLLKQFLAADALPGWIVVYCSLQRGKGHEKEHGLVTSEVFFRIARELLIAAHGAGCTVEVPRFRIVSPSEKVTKLKEDIRTVYGAVFSEDPNPFELLESVIESVLDAASDRRLFLMLDEFDKIQVGIETGVTSPQVPDNLRELFHSQPRVSAILSGSQLMKRLRREYFSPLFGLAHRAIPIGPLDLKSAQQLVTRPAEGTLVFSDIARDRIVELCACQPFLIQHICSQVFDICARGNIESVTVEHVELAAKEWLEREQHFFEVWRDDVQDPRRQYLLCLIAELEKSGASVTFDLLRDTLEERLLSGDKALADHLDFLIDLTVVAREDRDGQKIYRIAVPLLSRWLALKVDASQYLARAVREDEGRL